MGFRMKRTDPAELCLTGVRQDLWQIGASVEFCNEIASVRARSQFETLNRSRHLARDMGLKC